MITRAMIKTRYTTDGVYLSAKTNKGNYGQHYNMKDMAKPSFMPSIDTAKQRFMEYYNQFE